MKVFPQQPRFSSLEITAPCFFQTTPQMSIKLTADGDGFVTRNGEFLGHSDQIESLSEKMKKGNFDLSQFKKGTIYNIVEKMDILPKERLNDLLALLSQGIMNQDPQDKSITFSMDSEQDPLKARFSTFVNMD